MDEKKSFINSPFFCSEFQSVSRIVKIIHSVVGEKYLVLLEEYSEFIGMNDNGFFVLSKLENATESFRHVEIC